MPEEQNSQSQPPESQNSNPLPPTSPRSKTSWKILVTIFVLISLFFLFVILFLIYNQATSIFIHQPSEPTRLLSLTPTPDPTQDWQTYKAFYGFSFKYPQNWVVNDFEAVGPKILDFISINPQDHKKNTSDAILILFSSEPYNENTKGEDIVIDEIEGKKIDENTIYLPNGKKSSNLIEFITNPHYRKTFDQVLSTFRFLDQNSSLFESLCNNLDELGYPAAVYSCEKNYYYILPPRDVMDAPSTIVDQQQNQKAHCGGMPYPGRVDDKLCGIKCNKINICENVTLDCSALPQINKDRCLFENYKRTKNSEYCSQITQKYYKKRCPKE